MLNRKTMAAFAVSLAAAGGIAGGLLATRSTDTSGFTITSPASLATCRNYKATFRWDPVPGAVAYGVFLDGRYVTTTKAPRAVRIPVSCGDHVFSVQAADKDGNMSPISELPFNGAKQ